LRSHLRGKCASGFNGTGSDTNINFNQMPEPFENGAAVKINNLAQSGIEYGS
jgi:hypothetical protein